MQNIITVLRERGFIEQMTSDDLDEICSKPLTLYIGFDPTAPSLHLGNMVGIMAAAFFKRAGHKVIAVVGGATGMIGDPGGKSVERPLLDHETIEKNVEGIRRSLEPILGDTQIVNNLDWLKEFSFIEFLRDVGKHFRLSTMLSKEMVKTRLASEEGLSFTEFSYQLLQGYDFYHLNRQMGVTLQIGGSDQWGNIVAGTEFVRKRTGKGVYGLTFPLLTRSDGRKFGKSEGGAIWLNSDQLSPYHFYQYLYNMPDADMSKMFKIFTFLPLEEIAELERQSEPNVMQKRLAEEVTLLVHGEEGLEEAQRLTNAARPGAKTELSSDVLQELPQHALPSGDVVGQKLVDLLAKAKLCGSKGEARRLIQGGGVYLNNEKVECDQLVFEEKHLVEGKFLLLGVGKKKKMVISIEDS
ncbi:MAG: Tyrosine--tRNA ligase [Chlamydiales bacterium]|nr:Tyrosine--tRNA ligase [Chlamydiales bacterium]MCH9634903.1 Tyrosine--tRNA ligase [Chlamydiales bacterium]MCH9704115.1 tyrosine--tRNA ligase [Chlamydiota bacterium]